MANAAEVAAKTYVRAWQEPDAAVRARLIEACWAEDGRLVTRGATPIRGRAGLAKAMDEFHADARGLSARLSSGIDARGPTFRFSAVIVAGGEVIAEGYDAAEIDADGRITVLLTFGGPLPAL